MDILISGAGVAGLSLAHWLRRYGVDVTVVERADALRDGGYKVDVRGAAVEVLRRGGVLERVREVETRVRDVHFVDARGRRVATMSADVFGGREGEDVEVVRGDLLRVLRDAADVEYLFGDWVEDLEDGDSGVRVRFGSGAERVFDVVVGADGVHSRVRGLVFGEEERFRHDLGHHVSIFTSSSAHGLDREELLYAEPGRTTNVYRTAGDDGARALFLFRSPEHAGRPAEQLARAFDNAGWKVPELVAEAARAQDLYFDSVSLIRMDRWSSGRVVLVGDAAYAASPASGQGTSLALVGAYVLAGELVEGLEGAFERYETRMRDFVTANQALAEANLKGMVLSSKAKIWFQTRMLRLLPHLPGRDRVIERITEPIRRAATAIDLPQY
ncbi:FAD-dependent monooxygenase [Saccharothrix variisporea]|uniref:2-polyprenyl-6-methoxyphenol hydroxylase-like FAD-dependent oxidoreductase n=1 Tax=Saccharothrix variisporea TaxID=543527 RepID=A0A495X297_9PSEU|nr:FAD-dependent monooxygenase [Saccharothrix variisporea]RKT67314.1 2-polyprenyl-6-methoxyphenol hydroxylase-like FAD-dependent oxidoreductase [Saccharothrix variisporea]